MVNEGLSGIIGQFPVPPPGNKRDRNDDPGKKEEATGTTVLCRPRLTSIIVIGIRSILVATLMMADSRKSKFPEPGACLDQGVEGSDQSR